MTRFQTFTYLYTATATTTEVQRVKETGLSECLGRVGPFFCRFFIGMIKLSTLSVNRSGGWCLEIAALCHHRSRVPLKPQLLPTGHQAAHTDHQAGLLAHQRAVDRHPAPVRRGMAQAVPPGMVTRVHNVGLNRPIVRSSSETSEDVGFKGGLTSTSMDNRLLSISINHPYTYSA